MIVSRLILVVTAKKVELGRVRNRELRESGLMECGVKPELEDCRFLGRTFRPSSVTRSKVSGPKNFRLKESQRA